MKAKPKLGIERLEARISPEKKKFLIYAANLTGRTLTEFIVTSAYEAATKVIKKHEVIRLSINDMNILIQALLNPPEPSDKLVNAIKKYKKDVISE